MVVVVCKGGAVRGSEEQCVGGVWREGGGGSDVARGVNSCSEIDGAGSRYVRGGGAQCACGWATLGGGCSYGSGAWCLDSDISLSYIGRFMGGGGVVETEKEHKCSKLGARLSGGRE
jgi:hypothetical protein